MGLKQEGSGRVLLTMFAAAVVALSVAAPAHAASRALRHIKWPKRPQAGPLPVQTTSTVGWSFSTHIPLEVTHLGFYDLGGDGLETSHTVGIWDQDHNLLASAIVEPGPDSPRLGRYRYALLSSPILLPAGQSFVIGGTVGGGDIYPYRDVNWDVLAVHRRVQLDQRSLEGIIADDDLLLAPLIRPTLPHAAGEALAVNFRFARAADPGPSVPEPGLVGLAAIAATGLLRRRRKP